MEYMKPCLLETIDPNQKGRGKHQAAKYMPSYRLCYSSTGIRARTYHTRYLYREYIYQAYDMRGGILSGYQLSDCEILIFCGCKQ